MIYLDYAATAPMSMNAIKAYAEAAEKAPGNSSSLHDTGGRAAELLEASRHAIASCLGGDPKGIYFTGSGSEASILAIISLLNGVADPKKREIIYSAMEHSSITNFMTHLKGRGYIVKKALPDGSGRITSEQLSPLLTENTALVTIQHGNSETGIVQDIGSLSHLLKERGILFHSDCVQTFCKIPIEVKEWNLDAVSISAHKICGPKGIGAAWINPGTAWKPALPGTTHEKGFRGGTADVPGACSFAVAAKELSGSMSQNASRLKELRAYLKRQLRAAGIKAAFAEGEDPFQLPGIAGLILEKTEGQYALLTCNQRGIAISAGSACQAGMQKPSAAVVSLGYSDEEALRFIRVSMAPSTAEADLLAFTNALSAC